MSAEGLRAFFTGLATQQRARSDLRFYLAALSWDADLTAAIAEFASSQGHAIETHDLLTIDTVLEPLRTQAPGRIAAALYEFALEYLQASANPDSFNALGYYDPHDLKLWRAF